MLPAYSWPCCITTMASAPSSLACLAANETAPRRRIGAVVASMYPRRRRSRELSHLRSDELSHWVAASSVGSSFGAWHPTGFRGNGVGTVADYLVGIGGSRPVHLD